MSEGDYMTTNTAFTRLTIADHAVDVLKETGNPAVMYGDAGLLDLIGRRAGMKPMHPLTRWRLVLAGLERAPDKFTKSYTTSRGRRVRCFTLRIEQPVAGDLGIGVTGSLDAKPTVVSTSTSQPVRLLKMPSVHAYTAFEIQDSAAAVE